MLLSTAALAQDGTAQKGKPGKNELQQPTDSQDVVTRVEFAGQSVAIDRKTGKLRQPTPEEARALAKGLKQLLNRSADGLKMKVHADGTKTLDLESRYMSLAVAKRNPDGTVSERCVTSEEEAKEMLASPPGAAKAAEKSSSAGQGSRRSQEVR
ncbi:MAG: hypothetical protein L0212_01130 [Acidobacteria bacterium]|nr:hypothetical protein [Acidobacteriota bacterium]